MMMKIMAKEMMMKMRRGMMMKRTEKARKKMTKTRVERGVQSKEVSTRQI